MKKLVFFMLILTMAATANATIIDMLIDGVGSMGNTGSAADPLEAGETINVQMVLQYNTDSTYADGDQYEATYNGYQLSSLSVTLSLTNSTLSIPVVASTGIIKAAKRNSGIAPFSNSTILSSGIDKITGIANPALVGTSDLVWDLLLTADGTGNIVVDLGRWWDAGASEWGLSDYKALGSDTEWTAMVEADFGDLTIYAPEPMTIALLGLGGLFLRRRKK